MLYQFCSEIPNIPEDLCNLSVEEIRNIPDKFTGVKTPKGIVPRYTLHTAPTAIEQFLKPYFDADANFAFQLITSDLPIHKDFGRTQCFNYIINTGGNVNTVWYDDDLNKIESVVFPERKWHSIRVDNFHNVTNVTSTRIAITVWHKDESAVGELRRS